MAKKITVEEIENLSHKALSTMLYDISQENKEVHAKLEKHKKKSKFIQLFNTM